MEKRQQRRGLMTPLQYFVIGALGALIGTGLLSGAPGSRGGNPAWFLLIIVGVTLAVTGLIRGATKGWTNRDLN